MFKEYGGFVLFKNVVCVIRTWKLLNLTITYMKNMLRVLVTTFRVRGACLKTVSTLLFVCSGTASHCVVPLERYGRKSFQQVVLFVFRLLVM